MNPTLPLTSMTTEEKLQAMEQLWTDLCRDEQQVASPGWHGDVLAARGARFSDLEEVRVNLQRRSKGPSH